MVEGVRQPLREIAGSYTSALPKLQGKVGGVIPVVWIFRTFDNGFRRNEQIIQVMLRKDILRARINETAQLVRGRAVMLASALPHLSEGT